MSRASGACIIPCYRLKSSSLHLIHHFICSQQMTMMFEVQDLAVASPATVSRCGMVYLEPSILGLSPFVRCWLKKLPEAIVPHKEKLEILFHKFMEPSIKFVRKNLKEIVPTNDGNLTFSLLKILDCFFVPFISKEVTSRVQ